jgi:hypothetical protein
MQTATATATDPAPVTGATHSIFSHLLTLASFRRLELAQAIRLARMQLPGNSPTIADLVAEREINTAAIEVLEAQRRTAA